MKGDFILSSSREPRRIIPNPTEIHWRHQDIAHKSGRVARKSSWLLERRCGPKLVWLMDRIHEVHSADRKTSHRMYVVWEPTCRDSGNHQTWWYVAWNLDWHVKSSSEEGEARIVYWIDKARSRSKTEASISSIQKMESFKRPSKTHERNWKFSLGAAMPCKMERRKRARMSQETNEWEYQLSQENQVCLCRGSLLFPRNHEDHIGEEGFNSTHQCPKRWRLQIRKLQWTKEWEKLVKLPAWQLKKVKGKKGGHSGSTERKK